MRRCLRVSCSLGHQGQARLFLVRATSFATPTRALPDMMSFLFMLLSLQLLPVSCTSQASRASSDLFVPFAALCSQGSRRGGRSAVLCGLCFRVC